jgi:D-alanyl-D-alanine carboxypeptidase/D-alanyl-D-alanine-endopeptidase (penicillin-binding protein 4)
MSHRYLFIASFLSLLSAPISTSLAAQEVLPLSVESLLKKANLPKSALSLLIMPSHHGDPILRQQADKSVLPASTLKLVTSFIALDELGPNFRWKTQILSDAPIKQNAINGKLYLKGGGDPNFTWDRLSLLLRNLRQQGLRDIQGDIVLDRSYFQPTRPELKAPVFDENPDAYYNVIPDALLIHSNVSAFSLQADGNTIEPKLLTPLDGVVFKNQLSRNNAACNDWKNTWIPPQSKINPQGEIEITLAGAFPKNCQTTLYLNIVERNAYIASLIRALWKELGGTWQGQVQDGVTPSGALLLAQRESESLVETIRIINKFSDNAMARILFLTLGAESILAKNFADTSQTANAVIRAWLSKNNIADLGLSIENGSGLSRTDRISPHQLASILKVAANSHWYPEFAASLPIVGVDGSMRNRLKSSAAEARARIKTGTLKNAVAIAGYVRDQQQIEWIIVAIMNSDEAGISRARPILDELINWVANGRP